MSRKYFGEIVSIKNYQILSPKQIVNEVIRSLHEEFGKHPGISKTIIAYIEKIYFPKNGATDQVVGNILRAKHQRITN